MKTGRNAPAPTVAERARIGMVKELGCICCQINRTNGRATAGYGPAEAHHLLSGGRRRGHAFTIGLCQWHHRAVPPYPSAGTQAMVEIFGPSVETGGRAFHATYGPDDELLEYQEQLLAGASLLIEGATV